MPIVFINSLSVPANPTYSLTQYHQGTLEALHLFYEGGIVAVTITVQEQVEEGVWADIWATASSNTNTRYIPVIAVTKTGGVAGNGESLISLRSTLGWRIKIAGATAGAVSVAATLKA